MTTVNLGTCCGSDPSVGLPSWLSAGGVGIDTAYTYHTQRNISAVFKAMGPEFDRSSVFITSKIPAGNGNVTDCSAENGEEVAFNYAKENLRELGVTYVDLLLLHSPCFTHWNQKHKMPPKDPVASNAALWRGMVKALNANLTRAIGVSSYTIEQLEALPAPKPSVNQCNSGVSTHDDATIAYCQNHNIIYEAFDVMHNCPFNSGVLANIGKAHNKSVSQVCQRYVLDKGMSMAVGTGSNASKAAKEAVENLDVFDFHLTAEEFKAVDEIQNKPEEAASSRAVIV